MLTSTCAILPCRDMDRTKAFYHALGFTPERRRDDHGYLNFARDMVEIDFANDPNHVAQRSGHAAEFRTDDVDSFGELSAQSRRFVEDGFSRLKPTEDRDWGMREIHILDAGRHYLRVGQVPHG